MVNPDTDAINDETKEYKVENFIFSEPEAVSGEMIIPAFWF